MREQSPTAESAQGTAAIKRNAAGFAFEELLMESRAYRRAGSNNSDGFSIASAAGRTASWSMLLGLSLSEISNINIVALPVYAIDLSNRELYNFGVPTQNGTTSLDQTHTAGSSTAPKLRGLRRQKLAQQWRTF